MNIIETKLHWAYALSVRKSTDLIILHHAAGSGSVETVHQAHLGKGWAGIAYHYYVRKDGSVYRGRPEWAIGGHTSGQNSHTLGICFEGNFETETMNDAQLNAGRELIADIRSRWGDLGIAKHKDYGLTACPGKNFPFEMMTTFEPEPEIYEKVADVPADYAPTIRKLMEAGALVGTDEGNSATLEDNVINVDEIYCRIMTSLDRAGLFDRESEAEDGDNTAPEK